VIHRLKTNLLPRWWFAPGPIHSDVVSDKWKSETHWSGLHPLAKKLNRK